MNLFGKKYQSTMQGTLTCIFAPSVIIVPALSGLACPQFSIFKFLQPQVKPCACGWCILVDAMILDYTFPVDLGRLPDMTTVITAFGNSSSAPLWLTYHCLPTYFQKYI